MPVVELTLPGQSSSVPEARHFVESALSAWAPSDLTWEAAVCVTELAGNCALHAKTDFTIRLEMSDTALRIEVSDGSRRRPMMRDHGSSATTGRGLRLLQTIASRWGVDINPAGKTVWLTLDVARQAGQTDSGSVGTGGDGIDPADVDTEALLAQFDDDDESGAASACWSWAA
jgi:anti-sigma regulatory factor (Ser/Thr protein kinase)